MSLLPESKLSVHLPVITFIHLSGEEDLFSVGLVWGHLNLALTFKESVVFLTVPLQDMQSDSYMCLAFKMQYHIIGCFI